MILGNAVVAAAPTLPVTGSSTGTLALVGSGLVALGTALVHTQRRRQPLG